MGTCGKHDKAENCGIGLLALPLPAEQCFDRALPAVHVRRGIAEHLAICTCLPRVVRTLIRSGSLWAAMRLVTQHSTATLHFTSSLLSSHSLKATTHHNAVLPPSHHTTHPCLLGLHRNVSSHNKSFLSTTAKCSNHSAIPQSYRQQDGTKSQSFEALLASSLAV